MITCSPPRLESAGWQRELAAAVSDLHELLRLLDLPPGRVDGIVPQQGEFPLRVPRYFVGLMRRGDPHDPLLAQVLPDARERLQTAGYSSDPVGDSAAVSEPGLLQKYQGRALLLATGACAVHCRYCFRRHFPYAEHATAQHLPAALQSLKEQPDVEELILSGGDPLSLSDERLRTLIDAAGRIPHLRRLRIHTRLPVVLPNRVTAELCELLRATPLQVVVVIHANHPNEVTRELGSALARLRAVGSLLLNQSVLLKSVNDDADTLAMLSESLLAVGVMPYYLHLLDPVTGGAHFDVPTAAATLLLEQLRKRLPGYLVPRVVREMKGRAHKVPLAEL